MTTYTVSEAVWKCGHLGRVGHSVGIPAARTQFLVTVATRVFSSPGLLSLMTFVQYITYIGESNL